MKELQPFSEPVTKLIESVSHAIGILYEPNRIIRKAKAESKAELIKSLTKKVDDDYLKKIGIRNLHKEITRQANIESIIEKTIQNLPDQLSDNSEIDNDWLMDFFDLSQNCSNEQLQFVWAKLLANEVDKPNSISRKTLNTVKLISSYESKIFNAFCRCVWEIVNFEDYKVYAMIIDTDEKGLYTETGWGFSGLEGHKLEELNLIFDDEFQISKGEKCSITYNNNKHFIKGLNKETWLSTLVLTESGLELYKILDFNSNLEYYSHITKYLKRRVHFV